MTDAASSTDVDTNYMRRTLDLARAGWGQTAPNPLVGAVVVAAGEIVGEGAHRRYGGAHAEVEALRAAGDRARGATLYVSLEPCAHFGQTPPCVDAVIASGISRIVIAVRDPSPIARGGVELLRSAGVQVDVGIERDAAVELNAPFLNAHASSRPWITLKLALSADGAIADPGGTQRWITGPGSRAEVHRMRANADAIAVGVGTVLVDDPSLTVREAPAPRIAPKRVVFDSMLRTPISARLISSARDVETIFITGTGEPPASQRDAFVAAGARVVSMATLSAALEWMRGDGVRSLLVEGGARLAGSLLRESLVDRLVIFRGRVVLGPQAPGAFAFAPANFEATLPNDRIVDQRTFEDDVMTTYALKDVPCSPD
ncbi:MAG: bifunctional diaminohydroxyphosphoribosylaminopyrimidine deaminase/5-amino-6-(5-phosphoribosylamino)uracil reductase RibD [bacterium]